MENHTDVTKVFPKGDKMKQEKLCCKLANLLNDSGPSTRDVEKWEKVCIYFIIPTSAYTVT